MSVSFTSTKVGSNSDYLRYVFDGITKTDTYKDTALLDFALAPIDVAFVKLGRGDFININSTTYPNWFTGYITNDPEITYLGVDKNHNPVWGYRYQASRDELILSLKPLGLIPPFINSTMGSIIKAVVASLDPGLFDVTNVDDGPLVAQYTIDPNKKFIDLTKDLCEAASYVFYSKDKDLYFKSQDSFTTVTLDGNNKNFTPARLTMKPSSSPIINDAIVLGDIEPQMYVTEYFIGTGLTGTFPLAKSVFGVDTSVYIDESFSGNTIDSSKWVTGGGSPFTVDSGYLNCAGGGYITSIMSIPLEGTLRLTHGEFDFISGTALIGGLWTETPNSGRSGCVYGLEFNADGEKTIIPLINGEQDTDHYIHLDISKAYRYVIRTIADFSTKHRLPQPYSYIDETGTVVPVTIENKPCTVDFHTIVSEVDPETGELLNIYKLTNTGVELVANQVFAGYCSIMSDSLHATVSSITISTPLEASLATRTKTPIRNATFDKWNDVWVPEAWTYYQDVLKDDTYQHSGDACCKFEMHHENAYVGQFVADLLQTNTLYTLRLWINKNSSLQVGDLVIGLTSGIDDLSYLGAGILVPYDLLQEGWNYIEGSLTPETQTGLNHIPTDLALDIILFQAGPEYGSLLIDDLELISDWSPQLIGPNDLDALDGMSPVATIVSQNSGAPTTNSIFGTSVYNPGQSQLVFFKDSVHRVSNVPTSNQIVRVKYRAAGSAIGRVIDSASIAEEAAAWGDDGYRSVVRTDLVPRPRTSEECELAAKAIVAENSRVHYDGTYEQFSMYFTEEPIGGGIIQFTNLDAMIPDLLAEQITSVRTTLECVSPEIFKHTISFGKPDILKKFLSTVSLAKGFPFQASATNAINPPPVDLADVGLNYALDITSPELVSWTDSHITLKSNTLVTGEDVEFRFTDRGWGDTNSKNLIDIGTELTVIRNARENSVFMRKANGG